MNEYELKYGINPNQKPSRIFMEDGSDLPIEILNGRPGYINFLDAFNSWQLVFELKSSTNISAAASFKHVSPAGAALGLELDDIEKKMYHINSDENLSSVACAYIRARGCDRMSSFGDWIALSDECDESCANIIKCEVSDGIIAPGFSERALSILKTKKKGNYNIVKIDPNYRPKEIERRDVFGVTFEQGRQNLKIDKNMILNNIPTENKHIPEDKIRDLIVSLIVLKYTQSNSVCYCKNGQTIGVGAGQQSRIHCTRIAGEKADKWWLRHNPKVLNLPFLPNLSKPTIDNCIDIYLSNDVQDILREGEWQKYFSYKPEEFSYDKKKEFIKQNNEVCLGSDAFFPFGDNIERAHKSGVEYIVQSGGSLRDDIVIDACNKLGIFMSFCGIRLFHH